MKVRFWETPFNPAQHPQQNLCKQISPFVPDPPLPPSQQLALQPHRWLLN